MVWLIAITLICAVLVSGAFALPNEALTVKLLVEVGTSMVISSELEHAIANMLSNTHIAKHPESAIEFDVDNVARFPNDASGHLRLHSMGNVTQIEILMYNVAIGPTTAYSMASGVQHILGAGAIRWSVVVSPPPADIDMRHYFRVMENISEPKKLIASHTSIFSAAEIWNINGATSMFLNNVVMSDTRDEGRYHEMLVHPALLAVASPRSVLIIGGGEGAVLREVLRDSRVQQVTMVDIDEGLVKLCRDHLPMMHQGSFNSPKVTVVYEDGIKYIQQVFPGTYDVIIVDGIDVGNRYEEDECVSIDTCRNAAYGDALFTIDFYRFVYLALKREGTLVQYISDVEEEDCKDRLSKVGFDEARVYSVGVESFYGDGASFVLAAKQLGEPIYQRVGKQLDYTNLNFQHLNVDTFRESLLRSVRRLKGGGGGGSGRHGRGAASGGAALSAVVTTITALTIWVRQSEELEETGVRIGDVSATENAAPQKFKSQKGKELQLGSAKEAAASIDNDFGSWGVAAAALYFGHLCWLLKEICWILLIPYAAFFFGLLSLVLFTIALARRLGGGKVAEFYQEAPVEILIHVLQLSWQTWNCLLMVSDFVWDEPKKIPVYAENLVNLSDCDDCTDQLDVVVVVVRIGLGVTFVMWACFAAFLLYKWLTPPNLLSEGYAFQTCLIQGGWLAFWVLKDFVWTFEEDGIVPYGITAYSIHLILLVIWLVVISSPVILVDGISKEELEQLAKNVSIIFDRVSFSYLLWSLASLMWFLCEDAFDYELALRYVAAGLCIGSFALYVSAYWQVKARCRANDMFIRQLRIGSVEEAADHNKSENKPLASSTKPGEVNPLPGMVGNAS